MTIKFNVPKFNKPVRLDSVIRSEYPNWGRNAVQSMIEAGKVKVNGSHVSRCSTKVRANDAVEVLEPPAEKPTQPSQFDESWILANTGALLAINKPEGLLSESTGRGQRENLLDLTSARFGAVNLFHRLDRDTSGVLLFTLPGDQQHVLNQYLDQAFKARTVQKEYVALVCSPNQLESSGEINAWIGSHPKRRDMMAITERGGKPALTKYEVESERSGIQRVRLWPQTGRTHQLRVHMLHMGAPILGDRLYGHAQNGSTRLMLHAHSITLPAADSFPQQSFSAPEPSALA